MVSKRQGNGAEKQNVPKRPLVAREEAKRTVKMEHSIVEGEGEWRGRRRVEWRVMEKEERKTRSKKQQLLYPLEAAPLSSPSWPRKTKDAWEVRRTNSRASFRS
jgi:hypothetical protein